MSAANGGIPRTDDSRPETFFSRISYNPVEEGQIECEPFLQVCTTLLPFFDFWGPAFKFVKYDLKGNVEAVKKVHEKDKKKFKTLNEMLEADAKAKTRSCAEPLLWLKRGLRYIQLFLERICSDLQNNEGQENLYPVLDYCYKATVKKFHNFMVQKLVMLSWNLVPYRKDVVKVMCKGKPENQNVLIEDVELFLVNLTSTLNRLDEIYETLGLDSNKKSVSLKTR